MMMRVGGGHAVSCCRVWLGPEEEDVNVSRLLIDRSQLIVDFPIQFSTSIDDS